MAITNLFAIEDLIITRLSTLVDEDMLFVEATSSILDNELFNEKVTNAGSVGILVLSAGFKSDGLFGNSRTPNQQLKTLWNVVVVCPKDIYKTHGGVTQMNVIQLLKGYRLATEYKHMYVVSDERGFNQPEFINDLVYIPTMFEIDTVV